MRYPLKTLLPVFLLALALAAGTAAAQGGNPADNVKIRGTLTNEGVECQALRGDDGKLYTLAGNLSGFKTGDEVLVLGVVAEVSTCQQGTTIAVRSIQREKSQGDQNRSLVITGTLTDEGVECPALRSDDGQLYTLTPRDLKGFKVGDKVRVVGKVAERSSCNQETTLEVQNITAAK